MATESDNAKALKSIKTQLDAVMAQVVTLKAEITTLTNQVAALTAEKAALVLSNQTLQATINTQAARIAELESAPPPPPPPTNPESSAEMTQAVVDVGSSSQALSDAVGGTVVTPPPPADASDVLAVRLGKAYSEYQHGTATEVFPDQYLRPVVATPEGSYRHFTNQGLGEWSPVSGDFSSTNGQCYLKPDLPLVAPDPDHINSGVGVIQVEFENMSNNSFSGAPLLLANPDPRSYEWIFNQGIPAGQLGQPIGIARGYGRWSPAGLVLFSGGLAGTASTGSTAKIPHGGPKLPTTHKPTNICLTSGNEFTLITCIGPDGKGYLAVFANWGGKRLQTASGLGAFYHDWPEPYPGLPSPAIYCGFKLLGFVDLGLNFPTAVSAVASRGSDRVNASDGNAGTLGDKDMSLQATRDEFRTGNNSTYISNWGFAVVISRTENKAVWVDLTALFAGYRDQYTTTQELFDATIPKNKGGNWWSEFGTGDTDWPPTFVGKPEWKPVVTATVTIQEPTAVLVCEANNGKVVITSEDGTGHFYQGGNPSTSAALAPDGTVQLGRNVTCLTYDKYPSQYGTGEGRGFFAISRGERTVYRVNGWGAGSVVTKTLRDARMIDPVGGEVTDTHGLDGGVLDVCDHEGRQILGYRYTELVLVNNGGQKFGMGADEQGTGKDKDGNSIPTGTADWECDGILPTPFGKPVGISGTNVN